MKSITRSYPNMANTLLFKCGKCSHVCALWFASLEQQGVEFQMCAVCICEALNRAHWEKVSVVSATPEFCTHRMWN